LPQKKYKKNLNNNLPNISLYIHFPWCEKKCPYCDFNVTTAKKDKDVFALTEAVINDISLSKNDINNRKFQSVYFGGGTPSLVPAEHFKKILDFLHKKEMIDSSAEITVEFNPKEAKKDKIASMLSAGINRISLGVQSFDESVLNQLGRNHSALESKKAIANLAYFSNLNTTIDLIYGVMDQSSKSFENDINLFLDQDINHLSLYQLTIEPNTIFYKKELNLPDELKINQFENIAKRLLKDSGYIQYEVSSWCKENKKSAHNINYWSYGDFLGVGPGAHSKITNSDGIQRQMRLKKLTSYINNPQKKKSETIAYEDINFDFMINFLRMKNKTSFESFEERFDYLDKSKFFKSYEKGIELGLLEKSHVGTTEKGFRLLNDTVNLF